MISNLVIGSLSRAEASTNQIKHNMGRIVAQAQKEKRRREAQERAVKEAQAARELILDRRIATAMHGVSAMSKLCRSEQMQALLKARAAIGKHISLYHAYRDGGSAWNYLINDNRDLYVWGVHSPRDQEISVEVIFRPDEIILTIEILFHSYLDHEGRVEENDEASVWECKVALSLNKKQRKDIALQLRKIVIFNTSVHWEAHEVGLFESRSVTDELLTAIRRASASLAADGEQTVRKEYEWAAEMVMLRFLIDCSYPSKLQEYLNEALAQIT